MKEVENHKAQVQTTQFLGIELDQKAIEISKQNIDIGREAMRVDYNEDGTIELNSDVSHNPEAWIVQIQSIEKEINTCQRL